MAREAGGLGNPISPFLSPGHPLDHIYVVSHMEPLESSDGANVTFPRIEIFYLIFFFGNFFKFHSASMLYSSLFHYFLEVYSGRDPVARVSSPAPWQPSGPTGGRHLHPQPSTMGLTFIPVDYLQVLFLHRPGPFIFLFHKKGIWSFCTRMSKSGYQSRLRAGIDLTLHPSLFHSCRLRLHFVCDVIGILSKELVNKIS